MRVWHRALAVCGYISYAIILFALFAYLKFPSQEVRNLALMTLSRHGLEHASIGAVRPVLPAGLAFQDVSIVHQFSGQALEFVRFPELHLFLGTLYPFGGPFHVRFAGDFYGGSILGTMRWQENGIGPTVAIEANLHDIHPAVHPITGRLGSVTLDGSLTGNVTLQIPALQWRHGAGRLVIEGAAGKVLGLEIMGTQLPPLAYEQLIGDLVLQPQRIIVSNFLARGRDWQFQAQGQVNLDEYLPQSPLELTLHLTTSDAFGRQLGLVGTLLKQRRDQRGFTSLEVGGTLGNPRVQL